LTARIAAAVALAVAAGASAPAGVPGGEGGGGEGGGGGLRLEVVPKEAEVSIYLEYKDGTPNTFRQQTNLRLAVRYLAGTLLISRSPLVIEEALTPDGENLQRAEVDRQPPQKVYTVKQKITAGRPDAGEFDVRLRFSGFRKVPASIKLKGSLVVNWAERLKEVVIDNPSALKAGELIDAPGLEDLEVHLKKTGSKGVTLRLCGDTEDHFRSARFLGEGGKEIKSRTGPRGLDFMGALSSHTVDMRLVKKMVLGFYLGRRSETVRFETGTIDLSPDLTKLPERRAGRWGSYSRGGKMGQEEADAEVRDAKPGETGCVASSARLQSKIEYDGVKPKAASRTMNVTLKCKVPRNLYQVARGPIEFEDFRLSFPGAPDVALRPSGMGMTGYRYAVCGGPRREPAVPVSFFFTDLEEFPTLIDAVKGSFVLYHSEVLGIERITRVREFSWGTPVELRLLPGHHVKIKLPKREQLELSMDKATHDQLMGATFTDNWMRTRSRGSPYCSRVFRKGLITHRYRVGDNIKAIALTFRKLEMKGVRIPFEVNGIPLEATVLEPAPKIEESFF